MAQKSILITGCSSGIGYDAAHSLNKRGWRVFATCRQETDCARLRDEGLESFVLDYDDETSLVTALDEVLSRTGGTLDALYNNGAYGIPGAVEDLPRDALRANFETNLFGYHDLTCRVIKIMRNQGYGRIINCSSVLGLAALQFRGSYIATKFALEGLTDTLRLEMAGTGIDIILIEPGPVTSQIRQKSIPHFEKWINWKDSARRTHYEKTLIKRLYKDSGPDKFELPASAVTQKLIHALEAKRPRVRYYVTTPTHLLGFLRRILTSRALDRILLKS